MSTNPFPGPQPYRTADRHRFHGRQELSRKLLGSILAHRAVTVYGPSGSGKSSLMQASVIPQLMDEHQFRVVRVDSWPDGTSAASWLAAAMVDGFKLGAVAKDESASASILHAAQRVARKSARPFLIYLDQLEQLLFHSRNPTEMDEFAEVLQGLADLPILGLKLVLSLREDYLGLLRDRLEGRTVLLDHGFRVNPMRVGELAETMCKVAATGEPPQTWSFDETRALIMQVRVDGQAARDEAEAQAAFAQIVCRAIFDQRGAEQTTGEHLEVAKILDQYMETSLSALGELSGLAQTLLEEQLITPDGSRTLRTEKELSATVPADALETILTKLEAAAILRAEEHQGRRYFELGHDWLGKQLRARIERHQREAEELQRLRELQKTLLERSEEKEQSLQAQMGQLTKSQSRLRVVTIFTIAAAIGVLTFSFPVVRSYLNNQELEKSSQAVMAEVHSIDWSDPRVLQEKLVKLNPMLDLIVKLETLEREGAPVAYRFGFYKGDKILRQLHNEYVGALQRALVLPIQQYLKTQLTNPPNNSYLQDRKNLCQYLLLATPDKLTVDKGEISIENTFDWEKTTYNDIDEFTLSYVEAQREFITRPTFYIAQIARPHLRWYLSALHQGRIAPVAIDGRVVAEARKRMLSLPAKDRHYAALVTMIEEMVRDDSDVAGVSALKYPPVMLPQLFADRPDVLKFVRSKRYGAEVRYAEVSGAHTAKGRVQMLINLSMSNEILTRDRWVLGIPDNADPFDATRLADEYDRRHIQQWDDFLRDIEVTRPQSINEAIELYTALVRHPLPYLQIIRSVEDHTLWPRSAVSLGFQPSASLKNLQLINGRQSTVPLTFAGIVAFGNAVRSASVVTDTPLQHYVTLLTELRHDMEAMPLPPTSTDMISLSEKLSDAAKKVEALLAPLDKRAKNTLRPWLMNPVAIVGTRLGTQ